MKTDSLDYELPAELIAQHPGPIRSRSRLLIMLRAIGELQDRIFDQIADFLAPGDCLVINNTKVLQARFFAARKTGAKLEGLFLNQQDSNWLVMLKGFGKVKADENIVLKNQDGTDFCDARLVEKLSDGQCLLSIDSDLSTEEILDHVGFAPLPPYIKRSTDVEQNKIDRQRYQTVYADRSGAVAAPTAGLHFTNELIDELKEKGVLFANVTLHVGAGTFKPITVENIEDHKIHTERFEVDQANAGIINNAKQRGGRIVAVGTTSVRVLETIAEGGLARPFNGTTKLFITPGYEFKLVDAMVTNFHLPRSSLIALVGAFAGLDNIKEAYRHAIQKRYRFYSYGDAMFIF